MPEEMEKPLTTTPKQNHLSVSKENKTKKTKGLACHAMPRTASA